MIGKAIGRGMGSALGMLVLGYSLAASAQDPGPAAQASPAETATPGIASPGDAAAPEAQEAASSQDETTTPIGDLPAEGLPFAPPKPGQNPEANVGLFLVQASAALRDRNPQRPTWTRNSPSPWSS